MIYSNSKIIDVNNGNTSIKKVVKDANLVWEKVIPISEIIAFEGHSYGQSLPLKPATTYRFEWDTSKYSTTCEIGYRTRGNVTSTSIRSNSTFKTPDDCDLVFTFNQVSLKIYEITNGGGTKPLIFNDYNYLMEVAV